MYLNKSFPNIAKFDFFKWRLPAAMTKQKAGVDLAACI